MFDHTRKEHQKARAYEPAETLEELTTKLSMDKLVEPTTLVEIKNVIHETFRDWARKVNPKATGKNLCP